MALIKCSECQTKISDKASSCPKCACPISEKEQTTQRYKNQFVLPVVLLLISIITPIIGFFFMITAVNIITPFLLLIGLIGFIWLLVLLIRRGMNKTLTGKHFLGGISLGIVLVVVGFFLFINVSNKMDLAQSTLGQIAMHTNSDIAEKVEEIKIQYYAGIITMVLGGIIFLSGLKKRKD